MNILVCFGTRPEWLKIMPLIKQFKNKGVKHSLCFTGQHADLVKNVDVNFRIQLNKQTTNRLNDILVNVLQNDLPANFTHVLVQGDTTSALAMALWAFNNKIKIIHLEAGLRTYDFNHPYPEEANRQIISRLANIHFCATEQNKQNLLQEALNYKDNIFVVGNTVLDNIREVVPTYGNHVLVTLHRRENHEIIKDWFKSIDFIAQKYKNLKFILPIHPNPNVIKYKNEFRYVEVVDPLEYTQLIDVLKDCRFVITDSGGIQEEASFLNKKIIICRKTTERPECLAKHGVLCNEPSNLIFFVDKVYKDFIVDGKCPFGDGLSSVNIVSILKRNENI